MPRRDIGRPSRGRHQAPSGSTLATGGIIKTGRTSWDSEATVSTVWTGESTPSTSWRSEYAAGVLGNVGGMLGPGEINYTTWTAELKGVASDIK